MTQNEAVSLIAKAVTTRGETWADFGAGTGTFSRALSSLLGPRGVVYAVDRDRAALRDLERAAHTARDDMAEIRTRVGDFTALVDLPELDGVVIANALHYVPYEHQASVLAGIASRVKAGGTMVVVEYDRRDANRWVPYPITFDAFRTLARDAGLTEPLLLATRPSRYSGAIYSAVVRRA